ARGRGGHTELLGRAQIRAAPGSGHHPGRRDAGPRDHLGGPDHRRDRPPRVRDAAHQLGRGVHQPHHRRLPFPPAGAGAGAAGVRAGRRRDADPHPQGEGQGTHRRGRDHDVHARDSRRHPRREDPSDLLAHAGGQEARHADHERCAPGALHAGRGHARRSGEAFGRPERVAARRRRDGTVEHPVGPLFQVRTMPVFTYSARPASGGDIQSGELDLKTKDDVLAHLHRQKLIPVTVREKPKEINISFGTGVATRDIVIFTRQFATMINSGLPLVQSLDILAEQTENVKLRKTISDVLYDVESGNTLADAMGKHPKIFTELFVNMVAAGEAGGILDTILLRLATFLEKNDALIRKIKGAMIYPAVIFSVAGAAVLILLIFVIPTFQTMFESAGIPLPLPTRIVIGMSAFLQAWWWAVLVGAIAAVLGIRAYYKTDQGQLVIDSLLLKMPVLGDLQRKSAVSRFTRTLG